MPFLSYFLRQDTVLPSSPVSYERSAKPPRGSKALFVIVSSSTLAVVIFCHPHGTILSLSDYIDVFKINKLDEDRVPGTGLALIDFERFIRSIMNNSQDELRLLTLKDAAENLQISKRTLLRMIQKKDVPAFKVGGQWRIRESQFRRWVEEKENGFPPT